MSKRLSFFGRVATKRMQGWGKKDLLRIRPTVQIINASAFFSLSLIFSFFVRSEMEICACASLNVCVEIEGQCGVSAFDARFHAQLPFDLVPVVRVWPFFAARLLCPGKSRRWKNIFCLCDEFDTALNLCDCDSSEKLELAGALRFGNKTNK